MRCKYFSMIRVKKGFMKKGHKFEKKNLIPTNQQIKHATNFSIIEKKFYSLF